MKNSNEVNNLKHRKVGRYLGEVLMQQWDCVQDIEGYNSTSIIYCCENHAQDFDGYTWKFLS